MAKKNTTSGDSGNGEPKVRKPKGPELTWNAARRTALANAVVSGSANSTQELAVLLSADPAFSGVPADAITAGKIRLQLANQRKALAAVGIDVPKFGRSRGESIDVTTLGAIYGGGGGQVEPAQ